MVGIPCIISHRDSYVGTGIPLQEATRGFPPELLDVRCGPDASKPKGFYVPI